MYIMMWWSLPVLQYWMFSKSGEVRRDEGCLDYAGQFVMIYPCHGMKGNQEWLYGTVRYSYDNPSDKHLMHVLSLIYFTWSFKGAGVENMGNKILMICIYDRKYDVFQ